MTPTRTQLFHAIVTQIALTASGRGVKIIYIARTFRTLHYVNVEY